MCSSLLPSDFFLKKKNRKRKKKLLLRSKVLSPCGNEFFNGQLVVLVHFRPFALIVVLKAQLLGSSCTATSN